MRSVTQRVRHASVTVDGEVIAAIEHGLLVLLGVERGDTEADARVLASKIGGLRIFASDTEAMDRSLQDVDGAMLVVSQFTLAGSVRKGRRPGFDNAEDPPRAQALYETFCEALRASGITVQTGRFGAHMDVDLLNDGPVTLVVDCRGGAIVS